MSIINASLLIAAGDDGYQIERSLRFNSPDSAYLNRTPASAGNRKTWTWSGWVKRSGLGTTQRLFNAYSGDENNTTEVGFDSSNRIDFSNVIGGSQGLGFYGATSAVFRDVSAWYHIVYVIDTTQSTAAAALKVYVNGVQQTLGTSAYGGGANHNTFVNNTNVHRIGQTAPPNSDYFNGYLTEVNFIDGQALTPSSFGETNTVTGVWGPKRYAGTYGTNGFYLKFADNSNTTAATLGKDSSGNGNNWTPNNFSVTAGVGNDSFIDVPTPYADGGNGRGNYCTGNPLYIPSTQSQMSLTNGNLEWGQAATNANSSMAGTFEMRSGKWYWEVTAGGSFNWSSLGIQTTTNTAWRGSGTVLYRSDGQKVIGGTSSAYGSSFTTNDVIGFAYDADAGSLTCYKNNTSQGVIYSSGTGNTWVPCVHDDNAGSGVTYYHQCNFGQRAFTYTPPTGFLALNTQNLPEPSIKKPNQWMDASTYTGNGSALAVSNSGSMQPSLLWIKGRSSATDHQLVDAVRGAKAVLVSNTTAAETVYGADQVLFDSGGFTVGGLSTMNTNSSTYVCWQWKESATPGFDIVTYTGNGSNTTVAHSLGVAPSMIIIKRRNASVNWFVGHSSLASWASALEGLNTTSAVNNAATAVFNSTAPTSSVFSLGTEPNVNGSGGTFVAYLWSEVAGFSKFGSYTGNVSADGPFVYCGFRPKFVIYKRTDTTGDWMIHDSLRNTYNLTNNVLYPNLNSAEVTASGAVSDFLSNGFKLRGASPDINTGTIIFAAFAESPFKYSLAR